ncbi:MAG: inorganic phosphate transporter [Bacteroidaceae bacterium]|nr:inorganic phosphate transporter [Bacteroidaceae bacterium]
MNTIFLGIVVFLCVLAVFDLVVGVSNDAVNFLNSAIGAKVAKFRTIVVIAAIGVFAGAAMSNGMMDVARHGIMTPEYFTFYEVMCVFLAVMVTDVILLDIFNTLGMPTSTTVSMVFELLGGAFAVALLKITSETPLTPEGGLLSLGDLLNTEKAISVIMGIFLSVAIAFVVGMVVMWVSRMVFTFTYRVNGKTTAYNGNMGGLTSSSLKIGIFSGIAVTSIIWFLLINGLKGSSFMSPELKEMINANTWYILGAGVLVFSVIMTTLSAFKLPVLKFVVLLGTFALAMAFAGNDLVNFVGVPLTGLDAYQDFVANGGGDPDTFLMGSLMGGAQTPAVFLVAAGVVMVLSLIFSKKAQNVVKTSVDLSRQDEGDEMFGSSGVARTLVRNSNATSKFVARIVPDRLLHWIDTRFNSEEMKLEQGAAFDLIRAAVNLVLAGLLVAIGTSLKLPLSTTYVTFMVAMGTSLADRAWSRESAVFRITGVLSVIGGWFITAGAAFLFCFLLTNTMYFGSYVAMALAIILAIYLLVRSNFKKSETRTKTEDSLFSQILKSKDKAIIWGLLCEHIRNGNATRLKFVIDTYGSMTDAFLREQYQPLRRASSLIEEERKSLKRQRKQEIVTMQRLDPLKMISRNTWYFLGINSCHQMLDCLKRINEPLREHVGNNFLPLPEAYHERFIDAKEAVLNLYGRALGMLETGDFTNAEALRIDCNTVQKQLSNDRKRALDSMQDEAANLNPLLLTIHILQESQELIGQLRHMIRGMNKFAGAED